jgi:hypothetical protein
MREWQRKRAVGKPQSVAEKVSKAVWVLLEPKLPQDSPFRGCKHPPQLAVDEVALRSLKRNPESLFASMVGCIWDVYHASGINYTVLESLRGDLLAKVTEVLSDVPKTSAKTKDIKQLEKAFVVVYSGDAHERFQRHLERCCSRYYKKSVDYTAPYVTIMQSSGFGKSRILYDLAKKLARPSQDPAGSGILDMRMLYVCARKTKGSSGFPVATPKLTEFFFDTGRIAVRLLAALEYACANWEAVKQDWVQLFGVDPSEDKAGAVARSHDNMARHHSAQELAATEQHPSSGENKSSFDAALASALGAWKVGESYSRAEPEEIAKF